MIDGFLWSVEGGGVFFDTNHFLCISLKQSLRQKALFFQRKSTVSEKKHIRGPK
jgi:hypothetical protein